MAQLAAESATKHGPASLTSSTSCDVSGNVWLNSTLVEALAACDAIEPMSTLDQIRAAIDAVLAAPDNPEAWSAASRIFYRQFEQEDILGPYSEADRRTG